MILIKIVLHKKMYIHIKLMIIILINYGLCIKPVTNEWWHYMILK